MSRPAVAAGRDAVFVSYNTPVQFRVSYVLAELAEGTPIAQPSAMPGPPR